MGGCSAGNCSNRTEKGFRIYRFPTDPHRRKMWLRNMRRGHEWVPTSTSRLCEKHFEKSQFELPAADGKIQLKRDAVPTLFDVANPPPLMNPPHRKSIYKQQDAENELGKQLNANSRSDVASGSKNDGQFGYKPFRRDLEQGTQNDIGNGAFLGTQKEPENVENPENDVEGEDYETRCGEMFFTTKGRLIFHCTLCEEIFDGFDFYAVHIKEHIPISFSDGGEQIDETDFPLQHDTIDDFENEFKKSIHAIERKQLLYLHMEEFNDSMDEALKEEELSLSEIKRHKRPHIKSGRRVFQRTTKTAKTAPSLIKNKIKKNSIDHKTKAKQPPQDSGGNRSKNIVKQKEPSHQNDSNLKIPTVVREVQPRKNARSLLTPAEERKHKCPVCERAFKDRHNMIHHLKRHTSNRDHKCPECSKGFYTSSEVRIHMRRHRDERPFLCNICGRSYVTNSHLVEHLRRHSNQRDYKCEICEKAFNTKSELNGHMIAHSSDRPFSCEICGSNFRRQKALHNHLKLHENKQEFKCKFCDSGFNQKAGLYSHMKTAHKTE